MIRIKNIVLPFDHGADALEKELLSRLNLTKPELAGFIIARKSLDARQKSQIKVVYTVDVEVADEMGCLLKHKDDINIGSGPDMEYFPPKSGPVSGCPPVVAGSGPCGLFAALILSQAGMSPIVIERGKPIAERVGDVQKFWQQGILDPESNVCFGEGGAGTFSDGKLTTQIKDKSNRIRKILKELVRHGADEEILYQAKPHIGTDRLIRIIQAVRRTILDLGGQIRFGTRLSGLVVENGKLTGVMVNDHDFIRTKQLVLALGHSARDTYGMLHAAGIPMQPKPFSMGVRIEHPQGMINESQYGQFHGHSKLPPAEYKLVYHCPNGRSVYSFCMCPGGKVIASSTEANRIVTNGMSHHARHFPNGNSALLVNVDISDFGGTDPLSGIDFQRKWEEKAFRTGGGGYFAPTQRVGDFLAGKPSISQGEVIPSYLPGVLPCDLRECLPEFVSDALFQAIPKLDKTLKGFAMPDAVMTAIESRSSSPVKILRNGSYESPAAEGIFPAGEGAGYAGGIISSAVDGIRVAEAIIIKNSGIPKLES